MRGVILAGGSGSRLDPLTRITNKHLLPVYNRPMIYYAIEQLVGAGLDRILIVTGGNHAGEFLRLLGHGSAFGLRHLDYAYQEHPGGIAQALGLAEHFADGDSVALLLADNIFEYSMAQVVAGFSQTSTGACVVLAEVDNPAAYGVAQMDGTRIVRIIEKPAQPPSRLAVTGLYLYDTRVFEMVKSLKPSGRGELEITDINNRYLELGELQHQKIEGYWVDCGESVETLLRANNLVAERGANKPSPPSD
jgi:glucose-1-phosphate thymidylyltransferase